ncbi:MAG TPA: hypothetical protein VH183_06845 [Burkholderiaceae bacterium]|nr:hypothetical protein [Burkholderiaceae bacterium]
MQTESRNAAAAGTDFATRLDDDFWTEKTQAPTLADPTQRLTVAPTRLPAARRPPGRVRRLLAPLLLGWRERRHAAKASRELLELYRTVAAIHPRLGKHDLYRRIVMARQGGSAASADAVLARAAESYATWPVERALTFRDVVHYLAVTDYLATNDDLADWTRENLSRVVMSRVPEDL